MQLSIAFAPVDRQGFARSARRLTPPLTATVVPAQQVLSSRYWRLLRSSTIGSNTKFLTNPRLMGRPDRPTRNARQPKADRWYIATTINGAPHPPANHPSIYAP